MPQKVLEELFVCSEVQTARDRMEDYDAAEAAADANPRGQQELDDLRQALVEMPGAVRMLLEAIDRAAASAGEPQYDAGDRSASGIG
jgi:DNA transposition AAA+ family ATPase